MTGGRIIREADRADFHVCHQPYSWPPSHRLRERPITVLVLGTRGMVWECDCGQRWRSNGNSWKPAWFRGSHEMLPGS